MYRAGRTRMRGAGSQLAVVHGSKIITHGVTDSGGTSRAYYTVDPLNGATNSLPVVNLAGAYEFYRLVSSEVTFVPSGGSQYVGSIVSAYITNPELMHAYINGSSSARDTILYNEQGVEGFPLCERHTKRLMGGRQTSRTWFSCNYSLDGSVGELDRTIVGLLAVRVSGLPAAGLTPLGVLQFRNVYEFKGLGITSNATLITSLQGGPYYVNYPEDLDFPDVVITRKRDGSTREFVVAEPGSPSLE